MAASTSAGNSNLLLFQTRFLSFRNGNSEFTEEEMLYITTETPVNDEPVSLEEAYAKYKNSQGDENLKQEMVKAKRQLRSAQGSH
jgi:hypothetical protein